VTPVTFERAAMNLATNGLRVFPITPGSKAPPLVQRFPDRATTDVFHVEEFWKKHPNANPGVATGRGLVVVDIDSREADRFVSELELPETMSVRTARGGRHLYFKGAASNRVGVRPGLDLRGDGGYCVGAGSRTGAAVYEWIVPPWALGPVEAPEQLKRLFQEKPKAGPLNAEPIYKGTRNETMTRHAGALVRLGVAGEGLATALRIANAERCRPPLSEREIGKLIAQAMGWPQPPAWLLNPRRVIEGRPISINGRVLYFVLAGRADPTGTARGGHWIEKVTGLSERQKANATRELELSDLVSVKRGKRKGQANTFTLLSPPDLSGHRGSKGLSNQQSKGEGEA
jgi:hypothetical protein